MAFTLGGFLAYVVFVSNKTHFVEAVEAPSGSDKEDEDFF